MVQIEGISKSFQLAGGQQLPALQHINLKLVPGEFTILIGTNGSGKSTLLNIITGSQRADTGTIRIGGRDISQLAEHKRSKLIARIFQDPLKGTAADLSILENFRLASLRSKPKLLKIGNSSVFKKRVQEQISQLHMGLENKTDQQMGTLSGGQRQALTLCMAIMDDAELLLMDEPNAALDPHASMVILETAQKIIREHQLCSIMVTHNLKDAIAYSDHLLHLKEGKIMHDVPETEKSGLTIAELYDWMN